MLPTFEYLLLGESYRWISDRFQFDRCTWKHIQKFIPIDKLSCFFSFKIFQLNEKQMELLEFTELDNQIESHCLCLTFSSTALRRRSTLTILDKSPMFDSNSKKRFHTSTDSCGVKPPDESTRSNSTRVLLSSGKKEKRNELKLNLNWNGFIWHKTNK